MAASHPNVGGSTSSSPALESPSEEKASLFGSAFLWGGLATAGFYLLIPFLPVHRELVQRYFCGHPMEYLLAGLFFLGMAILVRKGIGLWAESAAIESGLLDDPALSASNDLQERVQRTEEKLATLPDRWQSTVFANRVRDACGHLRSRQSASGLTDHLKYLADMAADRLHAGYALVRTITWAIPILGFLGTVIGITLAISNLTPEQLDESLSAVTGGLGVAFDTTALALALSVVLVFTSFLVERSEQRILSRVEDLGVKRLVPLFPDHASESHPLADAELQAAQTLLARTDELIERQTELWTETLETTRSKWLEVMEAQKRNFDASLQEGMQTSLSDHAEQLTATRVEFLNAFQTAAEEMSRTAAESRTAQREMQQDFGRQFSELCGNVCNALQQMQNEQQIRMERVTADIAQRIAAWQEQLQQSTDSGREQLEELRQQRETLLELASQEERLGQLQQRLTDNLAALRSTESFEETLHSLSAAVHLLTARVRPQAA